MQQAQAGLYEDLPIFTTHQLQYIVIYTARPAEVSLLPIPSRTFLRAGVKLMLGAPK